MIRESALVPLICLAVAACASPAPASFGPAAHISASQADGRYTLRLDLPNANWVAGEGLSGSASLVLEPGPDTLVTGSGGLLGFGFSEVGGTRVVEPVFTADCAPHPLTAASPMTTPLTKSGGWSDDMPDADFYRQFLTQPGIRLPAGDWDVWVETEFYDGHGCDGAKHALKATIRIHVADLLSPAPHP